MTLAGLLPSAPAGGGGAAQRAAGAGGRLHPARRLLGYGVRRVPLQRPGKTTLATIGSSATAPAQRESRSSTATRARGSMPACCVSGTARPLIGNGAALPFQVTVKRPPTAVAGPDVVVAPGCCRRLRRHRLDSGRSPDRELQLGLPGRHARRRPHALPRLRALRPLRGDPAGPGRSARAPAIPRPTS